MMKSLTLFRIVLLVAMSQASLALGSDIQTQQLPLYPYQSTITLQDDFSKGTITTGSIGDTGFNGAGTITVRDSETNRLGLYRFDTSAVSGTQARITYPVSIAIDPALPTVLTWVVRLNTNDANTTMRIGAQNLVNANPPAQGIYFEKLDADTNWFCITRAAAVETRTDSGVAVSTSFATFRRVRNSSGVQFSINGVNVCGLHTANIPTVFLSPEVFIINSAAASKTFDVDYFEIRIFGIVR